MSESVLAAYITVNYLIMFSGTTLDGRSLDLTLAVAANYSPRNDDWGPGRSQRNEFIPCYPQETICSMGFNGSFSCEFRSGLRRSRAFVRFATTESARDGPRSFTAGELSAISRQLFTESGGFCSNCGKLVDEENSLFFALATGV